MDSYCDISPTVCALSLCSCEEGGDFFFFTPSSSSPLSPPPCLRLLLSFPLIAVLITLPSSQAPHAAVLFALFSFGWGLFLFFFFGLSLGWLFVVCFGLAETFACSRVPPLGVVCFDRTFVVLALRLPSLSSSLTLVFLSRTRRNLTCLLAQACVDPCGWLFLALFARLFTRVTGCFCVGVLFFALSCLFASLPFSSI